MRRPECSQVCAQDGELALLQTWVRRAGSSPSPWGPEAASTSCACEGPSCDWDASELQWLLTDPAGAPLTLPSPCPAPAWVPCFGESAGEAGLGCTGPSPASGASPGCAAAATPVSISSFAPPAGSLCCCAGRADVAGTGVAQMRRFSPAGLMGCVWGKGPAWRT